MDYLINFFRVCVCRTTKLDLAAVILPTFLKRRKLELDEQILWDNCHTVWTITTHRGPTKCKAVKYNAHLHQHYIKFYDTNGDDDNDEDWTGLRVSVEDNVAKKHCWLLDLMHLHEAGLMDIKQFERVKVDNDWTVNANQAMEQSKEEGTESPYWICGYCRGYVQESKASITQLGRWLNVNDVELKIINKVSPVVCPNCYRVRYERKRWEFIWEILSVWSFYVLVWPIFFVIFGLLLLLKMLRDPDELGRTWEVLKIYFGIAEEELEELFTDVQKDEAVEKARYVTGHYHDTQLIAKLNAASREHKLFESNVRDVVWEKLFHAKDAIDPFLLKRKINDHVMNISTEDELTPFEFFMDYINMDSLKRDDGDNIWYNYFQPLSMTIFKRIQKLREDYLPLHLFASYPFDMKELMDDFEQFYDQSENHDKKQLIKCSKKDIIDALDELKFLNCVNREERQYILDSIEKNNDTYKDDKNLNNDIFPKFVKYLLEVSTLFQNTRKIKNMLRDVNSAIIERGAAASLFSDQLYFLFDDIQNSIVALPFFNSMRTECVGMNGELKVELWTIRNTLQSLYFLNSYVLCIYFIS